MKQIIDFFKVIIAIFLVPAVGVALSPFFFPIAIISYFQALIDCFQGKLASSKNEKTTPPEPAFKAYFFKRARQDLYDIIRAGFDKSHNVFENLKKIVSDSVIHDIVDVTSALVEAIFIICVVALFIIIVIFHHVAVYFVCLLVYIMTFFFRLAENVAKAYRSITYVCPSCYKNIGLLYFHCDKCGEVHKNLVPGSYGLIERRCKCGNMIPTFDLVGRSRLPKSCPECGLRILGDDAETFHIALIGGVSTGKTSYMMSAVTTYIEYARKNGVTTYFPYPEDQETFEKWQINSQKGIQPKKTQPRTPKALVLQVIEKNGYKHNVYIYDAAGELYSGEESNLAISGFLRLSDGIIVIIDPFSIAQIRAKTRQAIVDGAKPGLEDPTSVINRLISYAENQRLTQVWQNIPVLVIVNKVDAIDKTIGPGNDIRQWLVFNGLGNFDSMLHKYFNKISYYAVSSLGCNVDGFTPFKPEGVLKPLNDMLAKHKIEVSGQSSLKNRIRSQRIAMGLGFFVSFIVFAVCISLIFIIILQIV